jgi:hypothetical protein
LPIAAGKESGSCWVVLLVDGASLSRPSRPGPSMGKVVKAADLSPLLDPQLHLHLLVRYACSEQFPQQLPAGRLASSLPVEPLALELHLERRADSRHSSWKLLL